MRTPTAFIPRRSLLPIVAAAALAISAAPAHAGLSTWTPLAGLNENNAAAINDPEWVRTFATGSIPTTLYAGTEGAGVWKSVNSGITWSQYSDGLLDPTDGLSPALDVYQLFPQSGNIFAVTSSNLWSAPDSVASGGSWSPVAQGAETDPQHPTKLNVPLQTIISLPNNIELAGTVSSGVYRSTDGGMTWQPPAPGNGMPEDGSTTWSFAHFDIPQVGSFVWAATSDGIYRSSDSGATWTLSSDGIPDDAITLGVVQDATNPLIVYALTGSEGLYRSLDGGLTWQSINGDPNGEPLGGSSATPTIHSLLEFSGASQTRLYVATSDGVWVGTLPNVSTSHVPPIQVPGTPIWRHVTEDGFGGHDIVWTLANFLSTSGTILAGTQGAGGFSLTFQPPVNTTAPSFATTSGLVVGGEAIASPGKWSGTQTIDYSYQWQRCTSTASGSCSDISGASGFEYPIAGADQGERLRVVVTASNDFPTFSVDKAYSAISDAVGAAPGPLPGSIQEEAPEITDVTTGDIAGATEGDTLAAPEQTSTTSGWYFNPPATKAVLYQWLRCDFNGGSCAPIQGAIFSTYKLTADDDENTLEVEVTPSGQYGIGDTLTSGSTNPIIPALPRYTTPPSLSGQAYVGSTLVGSVGTWASPATYWTRQWMQCEPDGSDCSPIQGATGPDYIVAPGDVGMTLELEVTAYVAPMDQEPGPVTVDTPVSAVVSYPPNVSPNNGGNSGGNPGAGAGGSGGGTPSGAAPGGTTTGGGSGGGGGSTGGGSPVPPALAPVIGKLSALKLASNGRGLSFSLSAPGGVTLTIERRETGHHSGQRCVAGKRKHAASCQLFVPVYSLTHGGLTAGSHSIQLPTKVKGRLLPPGTYRIVLTPSSSAGATGAALAFTVTLARG